MGPNHHNHDWHRYGHHHHPHRVHHRGDLKRISVEPGHKNWFNHDGATLPETTVVQHFGRGGISVSVVNGDASTSALSVVDRGFTASLPSAAGLAGTGDDRTAVYSISHASVYVPGVGSLEAHSGLGDLRDKVEGTSARNRGATPIATYGLKFREQTFHGVKAVRLTPIEGNVFGRAGLLAHSYMLGPNGDSNGCVSFKDYAPFEKAVAEGRITRMRVVP